MVNRRVAFDLGATSGRMILSTIDDSHISMETIHRFPTPLIEKDGALLWDIAVIEDEFRQALSKVKGARIDSIGIDTWGVDFCCVNEDGSLANPRSYRDHYTVGVPEQFFREMPLKELYERTGIQIMNFNTVFQMYARRDALRKEKSILFMPDALGYFLTGNKVCEYTILSTSALMNPRKRDFDERILDLCGISRSMMAPIVMSGTVIGTLKAEFGLGDVPVVAVAGHDTASAVAAVPAEDDNFAYLSSGTWSLMGIESPNPIITPQMMEMNYTNEGGASGNARILKNITGMWLIEQCLSKWRGEGRIYDYESITRECAALPPSIGTIDVDERRFASPCNMPEAITSYCIDKGIPAPQSDMEMLRLIYDSLASRYAEVFHNLESIAGRKIETLHIIGGGSRNDLLNRLTADRCGVKVVAGPSEATALGNIMIQQGLSRRDILKSIETKTYFPNE